MKKKSIKNLSLNKKTISKMKQDPTGGLRRTNEEVSRGSCGFTCTWCDLSCLVGCISVERAC
ncbi:hypothetical protein ACJD0Z_00430 [Flavobacteriaceae bacterium M23B6Z8]